MRFKAQVVFRVCEYQIDDGAANSRVSERLEAQFREKIKTTCGAIPQVVNFLITPPRKGKKKPKRLIIVFSVVI